MRPLLSRVELQARLQIIFPVEAFDSAFSNASAASALAAMMYIDAVVPDEGEIPTDTVWLRPSTVTWMSDGVYRRTSDSDRATWRAAALRRHKQSRAVEADWGLEDVVPWYADNSREGPRDETFSAWCASGAMRERQGIAKTASLGRWAITAGFADLFAPSLDREALDAAAEMWRSRRLSPVDLMKIERLRERDREGHEVRVQLPNGDVRRLEPGKASLILRGVVEEWANTRLNDPVVLTISEPGDKVHFVDGERLRAYGITIDVSDLLPDAIIVDVAPDRPEFWIIEVAASDGVIDDGRRLKLLAWAEESRIPTSSCRFLTAFFSRNDGIAKRRLKDLAAGSFAWYSNEPTMELAWQEIPGAAVSTPEVDNVRELRPRR